MGPPFPWALVFPTAQLGYVEEALRVAGLVTLALGRAGCGHSWAQLMAG